MGVYPSWEQFLHSFIQFFRTWGSLDSVIPDKNALLVVPILKRPSTMPVLLWPATTICGPRDLMVFNASNHSRYLLVVFVSPKIWCTSPYTTSPATAKWISYSTALLWVSVFLTSTIRKERCDLLFQTYWTAKLQQVSGADRPGWGNTWTRHCRISRASAASLSVP